MERDGWEVFKGKVKMEEAVEEEIRGRVYIEISVEELGSDRISQQTLGKMRSLLIPRI